MQIRDTNDQNILAKNSLVWLRNNLNFNDSIYLEQKRTVTNLPQLKKTHNSLIRNKLCVRQYGDGGIRTLVQNCIQSRSYMLFL